MLQLKKFFFTFKNGQPYHNRYVEVHAEDRDTAVTMMNQAHPEQWQLQYDDTNWYKTSCKSRLRRLAVLSKNDEHINWKEY